MEKSKPEFAAETDKKGAFVRQKSVFRNQVTVDGSSGFKAEAGRYHLYVSLACPWAHRTIIFRKLKKLEDAISLTVVDPIRDELGWAFRDVPGCGPDPVNGFEYLSEAYDTTEPEFKGRVTVPVLWDKEAGKIVNNESSEIIRMLNSEFDQWGDSALDFYPLGISDQIDEVNDLVYRDINNGVYRAGFAVMQSAYDQAFDELFGALDRLELRLGNHRYLVGDAITEADWRLFTTLVRFDAVYYVHFKCNLRRLVDYTNLWGYTRDLYQQPGVADTVSMDHIKRHYYQTHGSINPTLIVPKGPELDFSLPHSRERIG